MNSHRRGCVKDVEWSLVCAFLLLMTTQSTSHYTLCPFTHSHPFMQHFLHHTSLTHVPARLSGAICGSASCPRSLQNAEWGRLGSNHQPGRFGQPDLTHSHTLNETERAKPGPFIFKFSTAGRSLCEVGVTNRLSMLESLFCKVVLGGGGGALLLI